MSSFINIIKQFNFSDSRTIYCIGRKDNELFYGEEHSRLQWVPIEKFLEWRKDSTTKPAFSNKRFDVIMEWVHEYLRENNLNTLGI